MDYRKFADFDLEENDSPMDLFQKKNKIPYSFITHLLLALFGALQIILILSTDTDYYRQQQRLFYKYLLKDDSMEGTDGDYVRKLFIYDIEEIGQFIKKSVNNYVNLQSKSLEILKLYPNDIMMKINFERFNLAQNNTVDLINYNINDWEYSNNLLDIDEYETAIDLKKTSSNLSNTYSNMPNITSETNDEEQINNNVTIKQFYNDISKSKAYYKLSTSDYGPFDELLNKKNKDLLRPNESYESRLRNYLSRVRSIEITYKLNSIIPNFYGSTSECFYWEITQNISLHKRAHLTITLNIDASKCMRSIKVSLIDNFFDGKQYINVILIILSFFNIFNTSIYFSKLASKYMIAKQKINKKLDEMNISYSKSEESDYYNPLISISTEHLNEDEYKFGSISDDNVSIIKPIDENNEYVNLERNNSNMKNPSNSFKLAKLSVNDEVNTNNNINNLSDNKKVKFSDLTNIIGHDKSIDEDKLENLVKLSCIESEDMNRAQLMQKEKLVNNLKLESDKEYKISWNFISFISSILQFFGSFILIINATKIMRSIEIFIGLGGMMAFMNLGRYLEYNVKYSQIYQTINLAMPIVYKYLIGVLPIFLGFLMLGLALFWRSDNFDNPLQAFATLFSLSQGDVVFDIFTDIGQISKISGYLYLTAFLIFFMTIVTNIFIAIIEEAYIEGKMKNEDHWIFKYIDSTKTNEFKRKQENEPISTNEKNAILEKKQEIEKVSSFIIRFLLF